MSLKRLKIPRRIKERRPRFWSQLQAPRTQRPLASHPIRKTMGETAAMRRRKRRNRSKMYLWERYSYCFIDVYNRCIFNVFSMYFQCIFNVFSMYYQCIFNVLSMYCCINYTNLMHVTNNRMLKWQQLHQHLHHKAWGEKRRKRLRRKSSAWLIPNTWSLIAVSNSR